MPIYLAPTSSSTTQAHPTFKAKGITSNTAGPLKDLYTAGIATDTQVAYSAYVSNIAAFVSATNRTLRVSVTAEGFPLSTLNRPLLPIPTPKVAYISKFKLADAAFEQFVNKTLPFHPSSSKAGNSVKITYSQCTSNFADYLSKSCLEFVACDKDEIMPTDVPHYLHLLRTVSEFLATNTYPAFTLPSTERDKGRDYVKQYMDVNGYARYRSSEFEALRKKVEGMKGTAMSEEGTAGGEGKWPDFNFTSFHPSTIYADTDTVIIAKPSPLPLSYNFGPIAEVPGGLPGLLFPYFYGMNASDKVTLRRLYLRHFLRTLGPDLKEQKTAWVLMRQSLDRISGTPSGMVLAHLLYGIDLALQTQTRMFVIIEHGDYLGFTLLGERFLVYDGRDFFEPLPSDALNTEVEGLSAHLSTLRTLCSALSIMKLRVAEGEEEVKEVVAESITTSGRLVREIRLRKFTKEDKAHFSEITRHLRFHEDYLQNTPHNLLWALEQLTSKADEELPLTVPQYIPSNVDLLDDKLFRVLCAYGPDAPSLMNSSGKDRFSLPRLTVKNDGSYEIPPTTVVPPRLHVAMKSVATAVTDWRKMIKDKGIAMDFKERAGKNRCMVVTQKDSVGDIFYGLTVLAFKGAGQRGEKRKADDDMDTGDKGKKSARVQFEDAEAMLGGLEDMSSLM